MKQILAVALFVLSVSFAKAQDVKAPLAPLPAHEVAPIDSKQVRKDLDSAAALSDADKSDRFDQLLMADYLHFEFAVYSSDKDCAPRETAELATLQKDLEAVDSIIFPTIDAGYGALVTKAAADFKNLYDKDQSIQTELHN